MKKIAVIIFLTFILIGSIIGGGYYWYKKQNTPPQTVAYKSIEEVDRDIARLEPLDKAGRISWQNKYLLSVAYLQKGRVADAVKGLEEVTKLKPNFYKTYESLGMAYYRLDEIEKAVSTWETAVKMSPDAAHLNEILARAKQRIEIKRRIETLEHEVKQEQVNWQKKLELAMLYLTMKRAADAKTLLEDVLKIKKDDADVYDSVAQAYAMSGDFEKAIAAEKKALKLKPGDEALKKRLAEMVRLREAIKKGEFHKNQETGGRP